MLLISWKVQHVQEESRTLGLSGALFLKVSIPFLTLHKSALQVCPFVLRNSVTCYLKLLGILSEE